MGRVINNVWIADFETATANTQYYKEHQDTKVLLAYTKNWDGTQDFMGVDIEELFLFYESLDASIMVYFHNLSFDGDFILKYLVKKGVKMYNNIPRSKCGMSALRNGHQNYEIKYRYYSPRDREYYTIVFRCSLRILSYPVEALAKSVGMKKYHEGENAIDFYDVEPKNSLDEYPQNYIEYCKRDVEIVRRALHEFDNCMVQIKKIWPFLGTFNWKSKLTISSIAYKLQKAYVAANYGKEIVGGFKHTDDENKLAGEFYFGGFTQFNYDYQNMEVACKNGISIDINSAHPYSMTKKLPYGHIYNMNNKSFKDMGLTENDVCEFYELEIGSAELKLKGIANLANWPKFNKISDGPVYHFYRYLCECYGFKCFYFKDEFEFLKNFYEFNDVKIINHYWMHAKDYLKDYIGVLYEFKNKYRDEGKEGLSYAFKTLLNGGYGIHGKRNDYKNIFICDTQEEFNNLLPGDIVTIGKKQNIVLDTKANAFEIDGIYARLCEPIIPPKANNKFIACVITSYSRMYLWDAILKMGTENVLYTDTDSIYLKEKPADIDKLIWLDNNALGAWKIEKEYDTFFVSGAKCYYIKKNGEFIGNKYSGINGKWLKDNLDADIYRADKLELANLSRQYCKSGVLLIWKDYIPKQRYM